MGLEFGNQLMDILREEIKPELFDSFEKLISPNNDSPSYDLRIFKDRTISCNSIRKNYCQIDFDKFELLISFGLYSKSKKRFAPGTTLKEVLANGNASQEFDMENFRLSTGTDHPLEPGEKNHAYVFLIKDENPTSKNNGKYVKIWTMIQTKFAIEENNGSEMLEQLLDLFENRKPAPPNQDPI